MQKLIQRRIFEEGKGKIRDLSSCSIYFEREGGGGVGWGRGGCLSLTNKSDRCLNLVCFLSLLRIFVFELVFACRGEPNKSFSWSWERLSKHLKNCFGGFTDGFTYFYVLFLQKQYLTLGPEFYIFSVLSPRICFCFQNRRFLAPRPPDDLSYNLPVSKHVLKRSLKTQFFRFQINFYLNLLIFLKISGQKGPAGRLSAENYIVC